MMTLCTDKDCFWYGRYCREHSSKKEAPPKVTAVAKPIAKFSEKREKLQRKYRKQVEEALKENNRCEVQSPECIGEANGFQHIQKRTPNNLTVKKNQKRCCAACQSYIERFPKWAKENGHDVSKFDKTFLESRLQNNRA